MATIKDIDGVISAFAPCSLSESWDNDGIMLCKSGDKEVSRAVVCLEISEGAIEFAAKMGADVIITHHPYIFRPLKNVKGATFCELEKLISGEIAVLSYHTRLDNTPGGVNDVLAKALGLCDVSGYAEHPGGNEMGRIGSLKNEICANEFAEYVSQTLCGGCGVRYTVNDEKKKIRRVAVLSGAGKDFLRGAIDAGADAFVSADLSHNTFLDGLSAGIAVIDAGHYCTENPVCSLLAKLIGDSFPEIEVLIYDVGCPYKTA